MEGKIDELLVDYGGVNRDVPLNLNSLEEKARFLVELVRARSPKNPDPGTAGIQWWLEGGEGVVEDEWIFSAKIRGGCCNQCHAGGILLTKIFGSWEDFIRLPFVKVWRYSGWMYQESASFQFRYMKVLAEKGIKGLHTLMKKEKEKANGIRLKEQHAKLAEKLSGTVVSKELRRQLLPYADNSMVIVNRDIVVVLDSRSDIGGFYSKSGGGIGYYDQLRVFYKDQSKMEEWKWRDRFSAKGDRPQYRIEGIGTVKVCKKNDNVIVKVELKNSQHGDRNITFTFQT